MSVVVNLNASLKIIVSDFHTTDDQFAGDQSIIVVNATSDIVFNNISNDLVSIVHRIHLIRD